MGGQNMLRVFLLTHGTFLSAVGQLCADGLSFLWPEDTGGINIQNVIQAQVSEQLLVAGVRIYHTETSDPFFDQVQRSAGKSTQEGGVHHLAVLQIHHKIPGPFIKHRLKGALHLNGILKAATSLHTKPKNFAYPADENGWGSRHGGEQMG